MDSIYSIKDLHLPENKVLAERLKTLSLILTVTLIFVSILTLLGSLFSEFFKPGFLTGLIILFSSVILLIEPEFRITASNTRVIKLFFLSVSILLSSIVTIIGILSIIKFLGFETYFIEPFISSGNGLFLVNGLSIFLTGISFSFIGIRSVNRFYVVEFFLFLMLVINSTIILGSIYQIAVPPHSLTSPLAFYSSILFFFLSIAGFFKWPERAFIGIFTTKSATSAYALKILSINIFAIAFIGLICILGMKLGFYSSEFSITLFAILLMIFETILTWIDRKILYRIELENFIMKEELRIHNIDSDLIKEDLANKMRELKESNDKYSSKLNLRETYKDIIENME